MIEKLNSVNTSLFMLGNSRNQSTVNKRLYLHKALLESQRKNKQINQRSLLSGWVWTQDVIQTQHFWMCIYLTIKDWLLAVLKRRSRAPNMPFVTAVQFCITSGDVLWHPWIVQEKLHKQTRKETRKTNTHTHTHTLTLILVSHYFSPLSQTMVEQMQAYGCSQYFLQVLRNSLRTSLKSNRPEQSLEVTEFSMQ